MVRTLQSGIVSVRQKTSSSVKALEGTAAQSKLWRVLVLWYWYWYSGTGIVESDFLAWMHHDVARLTRADGCVGSFFS